MQLLKICCMPSCIGQVITDDSSVMSQDLLYALYCIINIYSVKKLYCKYNWFQVYF